MSEALAYLFDAGRMAWIVGGMVFLRIGATMALLPAFGERSIPLRVRLAITLCFTILVAPAVVPAFPDDFGFSGGSVRMGLAEIAHGLVLGIALRLFVTALQIAGTIAAQSVSLSQLFGGGAGQAPLPAIGNILVVSGLALAVMSGLHVRIVGLMIRSYDLFPPGSMPDASMLAEWGIGRIGSVFLLAFSLAAPFMIASLLYNVALGVINRAMPQLMVAFVGAPAITAGGLMLLALAAPLVLKLWIAAFMGFISTPGGGAG